MLITHRITRTLAPDTRGQRIRAMLMTIAGVMMTGLVQATEAIVDDISLSAFPQGNWSISTGPNPYLGQSVFSNRDGLFTWAPYLETAGDYEVSVWWTYHINRSRNVPYRIYHAGPGSPYYVEVDQRDPKNGGKWIVLGTFTFDAGQNSITVSSENGQASADAVRFTSVVTEWPEIPCPCDIYYSRAIDKYLGWGGTLALPWAPDTGPGGEHRFCQDNHFEETVFSLGTPVAGGSIGVELGLEDHGPGDGNIVCAAVARLNTDDFREYSNRIVNLTFDQALACKASVLDYCGNHPPPNSPEQ